ncbi:hypothetical protein [Mongoliibacter ruber]|uniref:Uncharacterized protein n=1 Tax=Mongoliibacter ruber TaxID=1750599 RepID=A0A2T0WV35_9BACT|nr:hypothetical protein [Mongoliibacter ruber]PRY90563.1 hypothetical protein CLW00_101225 [Mongoliibacter ruber]
MSLFRKIRRSKPKAIKPLDEALEIIKSFQKLIELQAMHFDREKREVWIIKEAFWDGKDDNWKANFCQNLKMYMDILWDENKHGVNLNPIHLYAIDIDTKQKTEYIITYLAESKERKVLTDQT